MIKKGDFITLNFTGYNTDGDIFDTTIEKTAKENNLDDNNMSFEPITVCVGERFLLPGMDDSLVGKKIPETYEITLTPEEGFGKKNASLIKLMPMKVFKKQNVKPFPGLEITVDNQRGLVKTVSGNRVVVDFNNPLSGHDVKYKIEVVSKEEDPEKQAASLIGMLIHFTPQLKSEGDKLEVIMPLELPEEAQEKIREKVQELTKFKEVSYSVVKPQA